MKNTNKILWGIVLVLLGIIWGINSLGLFEVNIFFKGWWTLFIIVPSIIDLFTSSNSNKTGSIAALIIGLALLLSAQGIFNIEYFWELLLPFIVVMIGLSLIFNNGMNKKLTEKIEEMHDNDLESIVATFGSQNVIKDKESFKGATLDSVFGGIVLDLTNAKLADETIIKASAIFGGIEIMVPSNVEVKVKSTPVFGGVKNNTHTKDAKKVIYIEGLCLFGGINIK